MKNSEQRNRKTRALAAINSGPRASPLSPLQRLPRRFQEQLFEYNETHSNVATVKWAARRGVKASCSCQSPRDNAQAAPEVAQTSQSACPDPVGAGRFGNLRYRRDEAGHAVGFWSLALAVRAGEKAYLPYQ
jgi:hypothetical protein